MSVEDIYAKKLLEAALTETVFGKMLRLEREEAEAAWKKLSFFKRLTTNKKKWIAKFPKPRTYNNFIRIETFK